MRRTKFIPAIVTLLGCLTAVILTYVNRYQALQAMIIVLIVLIVFYIVGLILKSLADKYLLIEELKLEDLQEEPTEVMSLDDMLQEEQVKETLD